ncbi:MAG: hypothetical protein K9W43_12695 [Candidatus Thorarchaeota archaeon]|nr:hypothetical protein [Candidatus Thorarchaeota archaeon]
MTKWAPYKVVFRLNSPLHIGKRRTGNLMETRLYVHGRVVMGAIVARLTRDRIAEGVKTSYTEVINIVSEGLRTTYFWPAIPQCNVTNPSSVWDSLETLFPFEIYPTHNIDYSKLYPTPHHLSIKSVKSRKPDSPKSSIEYLLLDARAGTALSGRTAEVGSLHQIEHIMPWTREGKPVYLVGTIFCDSDKVSVKEIHSTLAGVVFGGERSYGWGRVSLVDFEQHNQQDAIADPTSFDWHSNIPAHFYYSDCHSVMGKTELFAGWYQKDTERRVVMKALLQPGGWVYDNTGKVSPIPSVAQTGLKYAIDADGTWSVS